MTESTQGYTIPPISILELEDFPEDDPEIEVDYERFTESAKQSKRLRGLETRLAGFDLDMDEKRRLNLSKVSAFFTDLYGPCRFLYSEPDYEYIKGEKSKPMIDYIKKGNGSPKAHELQLRLLGLESKMVDDTYIPPSDIDDLRTEFRGPARRFFTEVESYQNNESLDILSDYSKNYYSFESECKRKLTGFEDKIWCREYINPDEFEKVRVELGGPKRFQISENGNKLLGRRARFIGRYVDDIREMERSEERSRERSKKRSRERSKKRSRDSSCWCL